MQVTTQDDKLVVMSPPAPMVRLDKTEALSLVAWLTVMGEMTAFTRDELNAAIAAVRGS